MCLFSFLWLYNQPFYMPPNLPRALRKGAVSSFFLSSSSSSSSFFLTICFFFHMLDRISTKLGQNDQWVSGYKSYALFDLKGHVRVTGVKRSFLRKMYLLLHALLDFDETWSETSVGKWLQKLCFVWPQRSSRGHRVKKVIYFSKCSDWAEILIQWSLWHSKHPKNILKFIRGH